MKCLSLFLLAVILMASVAVVGCGGNGGQSTPTATTAATLTPIATPTSTSTTGGDSYWTIDYVLTEGSYYTLNYSAAGMTPLRKTITFNDSDNYTLKMKVSKNEVNGSRQVIIPAADYHNEVTTIPGIMTGVDMDLILTLDYDAVGTLYTQDEIGDVDMSSQSTASHSPIQVNTYGDGIKDPAGSMVIDVPEVGNFETSVGQDGSLVFNFVYTTGHTNNTVHISQNKKMDGAYIEGEGVPFQEDGDLSPAPYVGTEGTLTETGTGDCLGIRLVGIRIDFQLLQVMKLKPVAVN